MDFQLTTAFAAIKQCFDTVLNWARAWTFSITLGGETHSVSILGLALGALVIYLILKNLPFWNEQDDDE